MERLAESRGAERWLAIHDELLRGIAHTLSNRVATISVVAYMLGVDGADVGQQAGTLQGETERLEELLHGLRALSRSESAIAEPLMPMDAVRAALALHVHHADLRDVP